MKSKVYRISIDTIDGDVTLYRVSIKKVNNLLAKSNFISDWLRSKYQNLVILTQNRNFSIDNKNSQIIKEYIQ